MEDFSEFVGLSRPTVSKYFNDPASVRRKTRDLIEAALKESGFRPNMFAVNLNRRRSNIIGIIIPNSTDPFYMALTRRVELIANAAGFLAFVLSSDGNAELEARAIETLKSMNVAGAVIAPLGVKSHQNTLRSLGETIPLVYVDSPLDDTSTFVGTNNRQSFQLMVDYLCRSGEPPCYLGMPAVNTNARTRETAYIEAMGQLKMEPIVLPISSELGWDFERFGFEETSRLIEHGRLPTRTILCANDRVAFGAISAAYHAGLKVGQTGKGDIRIAGHDDHPLSRYACPPITTVAQNYNQIGQRAMDLLFRMINHDQSELGATNGEKVLLNGEIMLRGSA
jgi:DNA-binding LacI/PurR family transcriptional regulator